MDVSVICPVFNTPAEVLSKAVRSVLDQSGAHTIELILVDDCSTNPSTLAALSGGFCGRGRVRVLAQSRNAGPSQARAAGIAQARHDWIGFIDSDDLWPAGKLDRAAQVVQEWPDTRWISGSFATLMPDGSHKPSWMFTEACPPAEPGRVAHRLQPPATTRALVGAWHPLGSSLFQRQLIAACGGFDPRLTYGEDWLLCLRASTLAPMDFIEADTYVLRRQGASMMRSPGRLSGKVLRSITLARRNPAFRAARRELRWFHYATYKDLAMNNALNGHKLRGIGFAVRALSIDPREIGELMMFLRVLRATGSALASGLGRYSTADQVDLSAHFLLATNTNVGAASPPH